MIEVSTDITFSGEIATDRDSDPFARDSTHTFRTPTEVAAPGRLTAYQLTSEFQAKWERPLVTGKLAKQSFTRFECLQVGESPKHAQH